MSNRRSVLSMLAGAGVLAAIGESSAQAKSDLHLLKERTVVRVGAAAAFPFYERTLDGNWRGVIPDLMQQIAQSLGVSVEYVETTWGTVAAGLQGDRFDIMGGFNKTPERALAVDFTRPIGASVYGLLSLTDRKTEFATWSNIDRKDMRIATVDGTGAYRVVSKQMQNVQWVLVQNFETLLLELDSGRSQVVLVDGSEGKKYIATRNRGVFITPTPVLQTTTNMALRKSADPQLQAALDEIIGNLEKQGQLEKIWAKNLSTTK